MKLIFSVFSLFLTFLLFSCGSNNKQTQSNLTNSIDEEKQFALSLYGDEVKVIAKGDLLGNGKTSAIACIVKNQTNNSYWIQKGSFIQKEKDGWKVILKMEDKLSSDKGSLVEQAEAKNGYIISFDTLNKPFTINIVIANEYGKASSDDGAIKWNPGKNDFEFTEPTGNIPQ
jgi:hypothetical protein